MAISDSIQTHGAAFSLGILVQAAIAALLLYFKGHGSTIFKEPRRLVLVTFLLSSLLWSQFVFLNFMVPQQPAKRLNICQITTLMTSTLDQIARVSIGGFLLWSVGHTTKPAAEKYGLGTLMGIRIVAGGFFVAFTRPQFKPVCLARSSLLPASITVLALDGIIIGILMIRVFTLGLLRASRELMPSTNKTQSKSLMLCTLGFFVWTAASVTMILGFSSIIFLLRTAIPATGLLIIISIITLFPGALLLPREDDSTTPEARSPFGAPPSRSGESFSSQSPIIPRTYTKGNLFVVNPPNAPSDPPVVRYQNSGRIAEDDGSKKYGGAITITQMEIDDSETMNRNLKHTSSGIFGTILAAPLSVPGKAFQNQASMRPNATISTAVEASPIEQSRSVPRSSPKKKSLFGRSSSPTKKGARKLGISTPIVIEADSASVGPFARMQTVDLATAAANERERREGNVIRSLVANRPAPQPPKLAGPEGLQQSISTRRKEVKVMRPPPIPMPPIAGSTNGSEAGFSTNANASSTSTSLSPGTEDVRRRSPRNPNAYDKELDKFDFSEASRVRVRTQVKADPPPESRRQNPLRSHMANQETVMYMKDIVYDQPGMVKSIISGVPAMIANSKKQSSSPPRTPRSSTSLLNRPRPYKRESDGTFFGAQSPRNHKRSRSSSSVSDKVTQRKPIVNSQPRSPTGLPALPPLPTSASRLKRLLPNDLRSMTVDEKILLLFPAPSGVLPPSQRRSSVPSIPRIPSLILQGPGGLGFSGETEKVDYRASKRSTISFVAPPDLKQLSPKSAIFANKEAERGLIKAAHVVEVPKGDETYRYSSHTYGTLLEGPHDSWEIKFPIPGVPSFPEANWRSGLTDTSSESDGTHDDTKSAWASLHSPIPAVVIQGVRANAIQMRKDVPMTIDVSRELPALPREAERNFISNAEDPNARLTTTSLTSNGSATAGNDLPSFFLDASPGLTDDQISTQRLERTWHHRLGDDLPTFSGRRQDFRNKVMPPPPPLLLNSGSRHATVVIKQPESEVINSPGKAIKQIQAQLQQFQDPNQESLRNFLGYLPGQAPRTPSGRNADRLGLLVDLEAEMGQQENHWMQMQHNFDRDSNSTMILSPAVQNLQSRGHVSPPPEPTSRPASPPSRSSSTRSIAFRSRRSTATVRSTETSSSETSGASIWQQRLAEAQLEFIENAPELQQKRNLNFLTLQNPLRQPGSPTPPESVDSADDSTQFDSDFEDEEEEVAKPNKNKPAIGSLWESKPLSPPAVIVGHMWTGSQSLTMIHESSPEPPAKFLRPILRKLHHPLKVTSSNLWSMPEKGTSHISPVGLWGSRLSRPRSIITRPKTQRPQRKSRHVTFLPDIVESPSPLHNKRDTLGIFQFPWGEKSDNAIYQPPRLPNRNLQVPDMLSSNLDSRSRVLEPEEYESSFFDDYDDEDEEEDSDDDFDESTLWEIASLLKSKDVPSKNSLLPPARIIEDYDDSEDSDVEVFVADKISQTTARPSMVKFIPIQPLKKTTSPVEPSWAKDEEAPTPPAKDSGLSQPKSQARQSNVPSSKGNTHTRTRDTVTLQALTSGEMWETPGVDLTLPEQLAATLWGAKYEAEQSPAPRSSDLWTSNEQAKCSPPLSQGKLWSLNIPVAASSNDAPWNIDNITGELPLEHIPPRTSSKNHLYAAALSEIESKDLWKKAITSVTEMNATKMPANLWMQQPGAESIPSTLESAKLWNAQERKLVTQAAGLFLSSLQRTDYRSSDKLPVGLETIRKPRTAADMLDTLTSQALWTPISNQAQNFEHNWIFEASVHSRSLYTSRTSPSSSVFNPDSDSVSIASASAKVSLLWKAETVATNLKQPAWWESKDTGSAIIPAVDIQKYAVALPIRTSSKHISSLRLPVLVSNELWESNITTVADKSQRKSWLVTKDEVSTAMEQPVKLLIKKYPATKQQWEAALIEAVNKGMQRPPASSADWKAALAAAISPVSVKSRRVEAVDSEPEFNVAVRHPVFFTSSRNNRARYVHPAMEGHVDIMGRTVDFDVAVRHPVFFNSSMETRAHYVHPAMEGYVQPLVQSLTTSSNAKNATPLWNAQAPDKPTDALFLVANQSSGYSVKSTNKVSAPLQILHSKTFRQPTTTTATSATQQLRVTEVTPLQLWSLASDATHQFDTLVQHTTPLWTPMAVDRPAIFLHSNYEIKLKVTRKTFVTAILPILESTSIWQQPATASTAAVGVEPKHWLHTTSLTSDKGKSTSDAETIKKLDEEEAERETINEILNGSSSGWLQPPRHTLKLGTMSSQSQMQSQVRALATDSPLVPAPKPTSLAVSLFPISAASDSLVSSSSIDSTSTIMPDLYPASIDVLSASVSTDIRPHLKRTKTFAPTGRNSIWTAPVRSFTMSVSTGRRGSALWDANTMNGSVNASSSFGATPELQFKPQRLSRRMSGAIEEQQVAEAKNKIEKEGQQTWRPKWGLPEKPTDWLNGAKIRTSRVDFRY